MGASRSGKTCLSNALGISACRNYLSVRYVRIPDLLNEKAVVLRNKNSSFTCVNGVTVSGSAVKRQYADQAVLDEATRITLLQQKKNPVPFSAPDRGGFGRSPDRGSRDAVPCRFLRQHPKPPESLGQAESIYLSRYIYNQLHSRSDNLHWFTERGALKKRTRCTMSAKYLLKQSFCLSLY